MTVFDFGAGQVPTHRHRNPDGTEGGWVAETARVDPTAWVGRDAWVYVDAWVYGDAQVYGNARVLGNTSLSSGNHHTCEEGEAEVEDDDTSDAFEWE